MSITFLTKITIWYAVVPFFTIVLAGWSVFSFSLFSFGLRKLLNFCDITRLQKLHFRKINRSKWRNAPKDTNINTLLCWNYYYCWSSLNRPNPTSDLMWVEPCFVNKYTIFLKINTSIFPFSYYFCSEAEWFFQYLYS